MTVMCSSTSERVHVLERMPSFGVGTANDCATSSMLVLFAALIFWSNVRARFAAIQGACIANGPSVNAPHSTKLEFGRRP